MTDRLTSSAYCEQGPQAFRTANNNEQRGGMRFTARFFELQARLLAILKEDQGALVYSEVNQTITVQHLEPLSQYIIPQELIVIQLKICKKQELDFILRAQRAKEDDFIKICLQKI